MRTQKLIIPILLLVIFGGCKKRNDNGGTFTVTGRWLKDCSGVAHANEVLNASIRYRNYNRNELHENIGVGSTDTDGYFSIVCQNFGEGDLHLTGESPGNDLGGYVMAGSGATDDIGTWYDSYTGNGTLKFVVGNHPVDTLFITNYVSRDTFYFYPSSGIHILPISKSDRGKPTMFFQGCYGIGRAEFNRPANSGDPRIIQIENAYKICGQGDTSIVQIP
ncbi:MAG: hypothetical protein ABI378_10780 [Chitinophagaceae bacterium]